MVCFVSFPRATAEEYFSVTNKLSDRMRYVRNTAVDTMTCGRFFAWSAHLWPTGQQASRPTGRMTRHRLHRKPGSPVAADWRVREWFMQTSENVISILCKSKPDCPSTLQSGLVRTFAYSECHYRNTCTPVVVLISPRQCCIYFRLPLIVLQKGSIGRKVQGLGL